MRVTLQMKIIGLMSAKWTAGHVCAGEKFMKSLENAGAGSTGRTKGKNLIETAAVQYSTDAWKTKTSFGLGGKDESIYYNSLLQ